MLADYQFIFLIVSILFNFQFTGDLGGSGLIWDLRTGKSIIPILGHVKQLISSAFSENGYHLATGSDDNTVKLWDFYK